MNDMTPQYLVEYVPPPRPHLYGTNPTNDLYPIFCRNERYQNSFYPDAVKCWNDIGPELRNAPSLSIFKSQLLNIIRPKPKSVFKIHNPEGLKYIFQLRVGLSALKAHKKAHNFRDTLSDICHCGTDSETSEHFLLRCPLFLAQRTKLLTTINPIIQKEILTPPDDLIMTKYLLYGLVGLNIDNNRQILEATIDFIISSNRFSTAQ